MQNLRKTAAAVVVLAIALLVGVVVVDRPPATVPTIVDTVPTAVTLAPAWCVDDGQIALRGAVADRIRSIRALSPELEVDEPTVQATMMAECPLPLSLRSGWDQAGVPAVEVVHP
jgi:hypothetical protein